MATTHQGSCHCGAVKFELTADVTPAIRCNCSLCRRKGIVLTAPFTEADLHITAGRDALQRYQYNAKVAEHYFCKHCGVHTFNRTRRDPTRWRANAGCLEDVDPYGLDVTVFDGASMSLVND
jgi:hypothetical protein